LLLAALTGCVGVAPDPAAASIDDLPVVELDDQALARRTELEQSAMAAVVQRQFEAASEFAERALGVDPHSARARAVLGMVFLQRAAEQDPIEWAGLRRGEEQLAMAQQLAPADAFVGWMQAVFLAECGHMSAAEAAALEQQALDQLRVVAEAFPDSADARFRLAVVAREQGDQALAEASYRAALERDAGHEGSLMNLAALAVEAGDAELARGLLERLLQSDAERRGLSSDERRRVRAWLER